MGTTETLVRFVLDKSFDDLPADVVPAARNLVLDCLGAMIFGSREEASQKVIRYVKAAGGVPEAGVVAAGFRTSLENAAYANGTLTHSAELEAVGIFGIDPPAFGNPQVIIGAALTLGDKLHLSGKELMAGMVLAHEFQCRISRGCLSPIYRGFCPLPLYGPPAVAVMAAKMMGLGIDQARMAVGGSMSCSSGFFRQMGTMLHYLEAGIGARNGITAALLAREGITADPDLIEGHWGFCELFAPDGHDLDIMTRDLGDSYFIATPGVNMKKHSCCAAQHVTIDALIQLMSDHEVHCDDVDSVAVHITQNTANLLRPDLPGSTSPRDGAQSRFSVHHGHAVALAEGDTPFRAFTDTGARNPRYQEARRKIQVIPRKDINEGYVEIKLKDGRSFSGGRNVLKGDTKGGPANPFTRDELVARHEDLCRDVLSPGDIQRSLDLVFNLENVADVSELMELVTFGGARASA